MRATCLIINNCILWHILQLIFCSFFSFALPFSLSLHVELLWQLQLAAILKRVKLPPFAILLATWPRTAAAACNTELQAAFSNEKDRSPHRDASLFPCRGSWLCAYRVDLWIQLVKIPDSTTVYIIRNITDIR